MPINRINPENTIISRRAFLGATVCSSVLLLNDRTAQATEEKKSEATSQISQEEKEQYKILEHLNPNLTEAIPVVICNFHESSKLIENNFKTKKDEFEIRNSNADTFARAISGSLSYLALLGSRVPIKSATEMLKENLTQDKKNGQFLSENNISNFSTISAFHFQTLVLVYGTVPLIKIFREAYLEALKEEKYKNDPRKVPLNEIVAAIKNNKDKIALNIADDIKQIKKIPTTYMKNGLGSARGYIDNLTIALSYIVGMENTGLGRFAACISRSALISRNLISLEKKEEEASYKNQVVRCAAETITWPSLYAANGTVQFALNRSNIIPNPNNNLGISNLKELIGNLVFMGIFVTVKAPTQRALENYFHSKFDDPMDANFMDRNLKSYIQPNEFRNQSSS